MIKQSELERAARHVIERHGRVNAEWRAYSYSVALRNRGEDNAATIWDNILAAMRAIIASEPAALAPAANVTVLPRPARNVPTNRKGDALRV